jgi:hypothetical protein
MSDKKPSLLAQMLTRIIDESQLLSREEWVEFLCGMSPRLTPEEVWGWEHDKSVPSAQIMRMIVRMVEERDVSADLKRDLGELLDKPGCEISPHGKDLLPTLGHYVQQPLLEGFLGQWGALPRARREQVLYQAADLCRSQSTSG